MGVRRGPDLPGGGYCCVRGSGWCVGCSACCISRIPVMRGPMTTAKARFGDLVVRRGSGNFSAEEVQVHEVYYTSASRHTVLG